MKVNEKNFIKQLKKQNEEALEYVVDQYFPIIKGITYKVLSPINQQAIIDECINDTFMSIWKNVKSFKGDHEDFKKWICAIAKFKAVDYYRKVFKENNVSTEQVNLSTSQTPEEIYIHSENRQDLIQLLNQLKPIDREILIRKYYLDESRQQIAHALNLSNASVDNRIYRCKKKLNAELEHFKIGGHVL